MVFDRFPLARGDTDSEGITQTIRHCDPDALSAVCLAEVGRSRSHPERSEGSAAVYQILRPDKAVLRMINGLCGDLSRGKFIRRLFGGTPTGFSESDVGWMLGRNAMSV